MERMLNQEDSFNFYNNLQKELEKVLEQIKIDKTTLLINKKIDKEDAKFTNRITTCIIYYSNKVRNYTSDELYSYYNDFTNAKYEYDRIMDIAYYISCIYGVDYLLPKKVVCCMLGMSVQEYNSFLNSVMPSRQVFTNIEEYLVAIRQEGAEANTRNVVGIDSTLRTKGESGGYGVKRVDDLLVREDSQKFNALDASAQEIQQRLLALYGQKKLQQ